MTRSAEWILSTATMAIVQSGNNPIVVEIPAGARLTVEREISGTEIQVKWNGNLGSIFKEDLDKRGRRVRPVPVIMRA